MTTKVMTPKLWYREQMYPELRGVSHWGDKSSVVEMIKTTIKLKGQPSYVFEAELNPRKIYHGTSMDFARQYRILRKWVEAEQSEDSMQAEVNLFIPIMKKHGYDALQPTDDQIMVINPDVIHVKSVNGKPVPPEVMRDYPESKSTKEPWRKHSVVIKPGNPKVRTWLRDRGSSDIRGVDTPRRGKVREATRFKAPKTRTSTTQGKTKMNTLRSKRIGKIFHTTIGRGKVLSRRPLGRR